MPGQHALTLILAATLLVIRLFSASAQDAAAGQKVSGPTAVSGIAFSAALGRALHESR